MCDGGWASSASLFFCSIACEKMEKMDSVLPFFLELAFLSVFISTLIFLIKIRFYIARYDIQLNLNVSIISYFSLPLL